MTENVPMEESDGDADALDPGDLYEPPSDVDPPEEQQLNPDADDPLDDVNEDDDDGIDDYSEVDDPEVDPDPEPEEDDDDGSS